MSQTATRRPTVYSRVDPEEFEEYQRLADRLYDGNLSLFVRQACREKADRIKRECTEEAAA